MIQFDEINDKAFITIFQDRKNLSTVLHETGHFFLYNLQRAYFNQDAPLWVKEGFENLAKELNFDPKNPLSVETYEAFAQMAEAYFREGKAPREDLQSTFAQFRNWLTVVYRYVTSLIGKNDLIPVGVFLLLNAFI